MNRFKETKIEEFELNNNFTTKLHYWEPEGKVETIFYAMHGGLAHGGDYVTLAEYFQKHNVLVIAPDLRGHNQSKAHVKRFDLFLDDFEDILGKISTDYPDIPIFVYAHSFGTTITLHYLFRKSISERIKGIILSSPYLENIVKAPGILVAISGILSALVPKATAPIEDLTDNLTRDAEITARHHEDIDLGYRANTLSIRFAREILNSQKYLRDTDISKINLQLLVIIAGEDRLADSEVSRKYFKDKPNVEIIENPDNYHEHHNEINRKETFDKVQKWVGSQL